MPWRLILFIFIFAVVLLFVAFNLPNRCDISFGFTVIKDAPVFLTVFISFFLGMICALPLALAAKSGKNKGGKKDKKQGKPNSESKPGGDSAPSPADTEYLDKKNYGID